MPVKAPAALATPGSGPLPSAAAESGAAGTAGVAGGAGPGNPGGAGGGTTTAGGNVTVGAKRRARTKEDEAERLRALMETLQHPPYNFNDRSVRVDDELRKLAQTIANAQANMEALEKKYKESVLLGRIHQNAAQLFSTDMTLALPTGDPIEDLIIKAREELRRHNAAVQVENEKRAQVRAESQQALQAAIANTKKLSKEQQRLVGEGPKFAYHIFTGFGTATFVDAVKSDTYMLVTSGGVIEIWQTSVVSGETQASATSITTFSIGRIVKVEPVGVLNETPKPTVSFEKEVEEATGQAARTKGPATTSGPGKEAPATPDAVHSGHNLADEQKPSTEDSTRSRPTTDVGSDVSRPSTQRSWPKTRPETAASASLDMEEGQNAVDTPQVAPFTITRRRYFVGTEAGRGYLLTLLVTEERQTGKTEHEISLSQEIMFSQQPIHHATFTAHNNQVVIVVADIPGAPKTYALLALDVPTLKPLWRVPVDRMDQRTTGHIAQIAVLPLRLADFVYAPSRPIADTPRGGGRRSSNVSVFADIAGSGRHATIADAAAPSDEDPNCKVTAITYDPNNNTLLVALRSGRVVRVTHETIASTAEPPHHTEGANQEAKPHDGKAGGGTEAEQQEATTSLPVEGKKEISAPEEIRQEISLSVLFVVNPYVSPSSPSEADDSITPETKFPEVYSMVTFLHPISNSASLLLGCRDGSVRLVSVDHATVGQEMFFTRVEDFATPAEQAVDISVGYIYLGENAAFVMSYTSIGTFAVFNIADPSAPRVASIRVLVNRHSFENRSTSEPKTQSGGGGGGGGGGERDLRAYARPGTANTTSSARAGKARNLRVFPKQEASAASVCLVTENQWSLVRLESLANYLRQHGVRPAEADAR